MRITWVTRSFLDYRIAVYRELNKLCNNELTVIYNAEVVPIHCQESLSELLQERAIGLKGELRIGGKKVDNASFANSGLRIPIQKGLIAEIKKTKPQLLLTDGFFQWTYAAYWFRLFKRVPHIMLYERTKHTERHTPLWRTLFRKSLLPLIDAIGCNGTETFNYLKDTLKVNERKLFTGNMAVDNQLLADNVNAVKAEVLQEKDKTRHVFLYVGQLIPRKGLVELVETWELFSNQNPNIELLIVGAGPLENTLKNTIDNKQIESINFVGRVPYEDVPRYYAKAEVFIIPTLEDNWSLVVPEAMSCGLPIMSSKYNGCWPELVRKENGWVFDPLNEKDFLKTLETVVAEKGFWKQMGKESAKIVEEYSPKKIAKQIFKSINKNIK